MPVQNTSPNLLGAPTNPTTDTTAAVTMRQGVVFSGQVQSTYLIVLTGATGGSWSATVGGQTATALSPTITAANLQTAIAALSTVGAGNVTVTGAGSAANPFQVTFSGTPVVSGIAPAMSVSGANLTGTNPTVALTGSDVDIYTVPAASALTVASGTLTNVGASPVTVGIGITPAGQTSGLAYKSMFSVILPPADIAYPGGNSISLRDTIAGDMLGPGDKISVYSSQPGAVSAKVTGALTS